jgi:hypothetical protein
VLETEYKKLYNNKATKAEFDDVKPQIEKNKELITAQEIVKNLAKLPLNACYGSTLVNSMRFTEVELVDNNNMKRIHKLGSSFRFKDMLITDRINLIHKAPYAFKLSYSIMLGVAILDDSKIQMSKIIMKLYDFVTSKGLELKACYCDSDSYV